jgi:cell wall-associated NlpC family hydrolase
MRPTRTPASLALAAGFAATLIAAVPAAGLSHADRKVKPPTHKQRAAASAAAFAQDVEQLQSAASDITQQALSVGALRQPPPYHAAAKRLYVAVAALERKARQEDPSLAPQDTRDVMGPVPDPMLHQRSSQPHHRRIRTTHTLLRWTGQQVPAHPSMGNGHNKPFAGSWPATFRRPDGVYVDPWLPAVPYPTVGDIAVRAALHELGQPYVWAGGGPSVFDCSGLVQWAYAKAGISLGHYTGYQWNEGRLIAPRDMLPGDLILFGNPTHHVGIYLGAGWMVNAPYTGQYVDVVPVGAGVAGVIRP